MNSAKGFDFRTLRIERWLRLTHRLRTENDARLEQAAVVNVLLLLVHAHATSVAIFLRRDFGKEALAANSLVAMFILFVMATQDPVFMTYLGLFLAMQIYRRIETFRKAWRGENLAQPLSRLSLYRLETPERHG